MSEGLDADNLPPGTAAHCWLAIGGERVEGGWRYPERNAHGERIGTLTRWDAPAEGQPRYTAAKGGKRGLIFPADGLPAYAGTSPRDPILVAERATRRVFTRSPSRRWACRWRARPRASSLSYFETAMSS